MAERSDEVRRAGDSLSHTLGTPTFESLGERLRAVCEDGGAADGLVTAIETEILPRLMLAHGTSWGEESAAELEASFASPEQIDAFVDILIDGSASAAGRVIESLADSGVPIEDVFLQFMAPTARRLGEMWETDACDFTDVTIGLCRLHELLRHNSVIGDEAFQRGGGSQPAVLLATACGDQHVFGLLMVAEFFRRDGWRVWSEPGASAGELARLAKEESFDIIGLSLARSIEENDVRAEIKALRAASRNKDVKIIIGGACVARDQSIGARLGADGYSVDASAAPQLARSLVVERVWA